MSVLIMKCTVVVETKKAILIQSKHGMAWFDIEDIVGRSKISGSIEKITVPEELARMKGMSNECENS